jgi:26S proteasome regulatory subunit N1
MAFQLARQQIHIETDDADLNACINNINLSRYFLSLARELDVMEPKIPEDIYKSHLENHSKFFFFSFFFLIKYSNSSNRNCI